VQGAYRAIKLFFKSRLNFDWHEFFWRGSHRMIQKPISGAKKIPLSGGVAAQRVKAKNANEAAATLEFLLSLVLRVCTTTVLQKLRPQ
jgi:hypothetical protein